ncbi:MAG: ABC transporter ATP-binding protein [Patescibacteria group bacterium]|nr:ABC transporter ATP-binding protein [Patescibacteria group bacterium]
MIEVKDLKKIYGQGEVKTVALDGISLKIEKGEFVAIKGPSGCGKSTLMHIMGFLDRPTSGLYKFKGRSINDFSDDELAKIRNREVGFIFQSFNLLPRLTVLENVKLPLIYTHFSQQKIDQRAKESLEAVGLKGRINYFPNQLSGGEQQRVAIARALVNNPSVIFADEPTGNLDSKSGQQIIALLQELNEKGHTIVMVTHETYTAEAAKRIVEMKDGRVVNDELVKKRHFAKDGFIK